MKKILSLIALLVVTLTAFAQSTSEKIIPDGTQPNGGVPSHLKQSQSTGLPRRL